MTLGELNSEDTMFGCPMDSDKYGYLIGENHPHLRSQVSTAGMCVEHGGIFGWGREEL